MGVKWLDMRYAATPTTASMAGSATAAALGVATSASSAPSASVVSSATYSSTACLIPKPVGGTHGLPAGSRRFPSGAIRQKLESVLLPCHADPLAQLLPVHGVLVHEVDGAAVVALELVGLDEFQDGGVEADLGASAMLVKTEAHFVPRHGVDERRHGSEEGREEPGHVDEQRAAEAWPWGVS